MNIRSRCQNTWTLGQEDACITTHRLYKRLGSNNAKRLEAYRALFETHIGEDTINLILKNTQQGTIVGESLFQTEIKNMLKRRVMKHQHGGDRKADRYNKVSSVLTPWSFKSSRAWRLQWVWYWFKHPCWRGCKPLHLDDLLLSAAGELLIAAITWFGQFNRRAASI